MSITRIGDLRIGRRRMLVATGSSTALAVLGVRPALALPARMPVAVQPSEPFNVPQFNIRYVVTDRRLPQSLAFGEAYAASGGTRLEVTEGLTRLWQESLAPLWRERGGAVAGFTTREVWHCLAEQARSQSHRTIMLQQHDAAADQLYPLVSWIIA